MELQGERLIPASIDATWSALNDPATLKACIAGCEALDRSGDDAFAAVVAVKVGPVSARFRGNLKMTDVRAPQSYTIHFDGQGGVAGFGKGSADVTLKPEGPGTRLAYAARAQVGGRLAQIGSRLVDAAAAKIAEDFFKAFEAHVQAGNDAAAAAPVAAVAVDGPMPAPAQTPALVAPPKPVAAPAPVAGPAMATPGASANALWWVAGAVAVAALLYSLAR